MTSGFESLHPAIQHHIVNSLGWRALRPLQETAIAPILGGEHALLIAPTAGGKTEAAIFPLLSRMLSEDWRGLSVLYVCPIKALLNNLEPRLAHYAGLVGRRVGLWHGDVGQAARRRMQEEPPDLLLTTPESLEAMLIFRREERDALFSRLRCVVVDELHAFAGDFRGWHLLAVTERLVKVAGRDLQRLGLSATLGNPERLLTWLAGSSPAPRRVIAPPAPPGPAPDVCLDYVGSLQNAAVVISRLHRDEKRLVFCDSRSRVEQLAAGLRDLGVRTFVSHSSLSLEERRQAEAAFQQAQDCVIVATSTLELGIDVGDLDRVVQIDAPSTVASFLQRLGRTGRRSGTSRNCLFLATTENAFLQAAGLLRLWSEGYVEAVEPPTDPLHLFAQQLLALALQEGTIGRHTWRDWLGPFVAAAGLVDGDLEATLGYMVEHGLLFEEHGLLSIGDAGAESFGRKNFLELCSIFSSPPLFKVLHGRTELGYVHETTFQVKDGQQAVLLLAGRSWALRSLDWRRKTAYVEPSDVQGRSRWEGSVRALHFDLCRAIRRVLSDGVVPVTLTQRAQERLQEVRDELTWLQTEGTALVRDGVELLWWTFAGRLANQTLAHHLGALSDTPTRATNHYVRLQSSCEVDALRQALDDLRGRVETLAPDVAADALTGLKFSACLPPTLATRLVSRRISDPAAVARVLAEPLRVVTVS